MLMYFREWDALHWLSTITLVFHNIASVVHNDSGFLQHNIGCPQWQWFSTTWHLIVADSDNDHGFPQLHWSWFSPITLVFRNMTLHWLSTMTVTLTMVFPNYVDLEIGFRPTLECSCNLHLKQTCCCRVLWLLRQNSDFQTYRNANANAFKKKNSPQL